MLDEMAGTRVSACYQCGNCSAGCPVCESMDRPPHVVIRCLQLGCIGELKDVNTAWVCAACQGCSVRCPRGVDIARVMEALRQMVLRREGNVVDLNGIGAEELGDLPPIAVVGACRKLTQ
jgi:heterodisulfide reductase subunit C